MQSSYTGSKKTMRIRFVSLYLASVVLMAFIFFAFTDKTTPPAAVKREKVEVAKYVADPQQEKLLAQSQNEVQEKNSKITELESKIQSLQAQLQNKSNEPVTTQIKSDPNTAAALASLRAKVNELTESNASLSRMNRELRRNNEYLSAQLR